MNHAKASARRRIDREAREARDEEAAAHRGHMPWMADDEAPAPRVKQLFRYAIVCPSCGHSAVVKVPRAKRFARMRCSACKELAPLGIRKELWKAEATESA